MTSTLLDHLVILAPTLAEGVAYVEDCLGVTPGPGGKHPLMSTHNRLVQLGGDRFLEVLAIDPEAPAPGRPRWFGLDNGENLKRNWAQGRRLSAYVARSHRLCDHLAREAPVLGVATEAKRGDLVWHFGVTADGSLPLDGAAPYLMDWGKPGTPVARMAEAGLRLEQFIVETPDIEETEAFLARLDLADPPVLRRGRDLRLLAVIDTPSGSRLLT